MMVRNLFLALFLFALALPAFAVPVTSAAASQPAAADCHGMPVDEQDDGAQRHDKSVRLHGCIGCIAALSPVFAVMAKALLPFITQGLPHLKLSGTATRPTIPPPRA